MFFTKKTYAEQPETLRRICMSRLSQSQHNDTGLSQKLVNSHLQNVRDHLEPSSPLTLSTMASYRIRNRYSNPSTTLRTWMWTWNRDQDSIPIQVDLGHHNKPFVAMATWLNTRTEPRGGRNGGKAGQFYSSKRVWMTSKFESVGSFIIYIGYVVL